MLFLRHPAWLWLKRHDKAKLPPVGDTLQAMFDDGHLFEEYAERLFPNAVKLGFENGGYRLMPQKTKEAINSSVKTILQGRVETNGLTCIFDVLDRVMDKEFDLYEIKSSTDVKDEHIFDLAFQTIVLESTGLSLRNISIICVNNKYVRNGKIDVSQITCRHDVTAQVREQIEKVRSLIEQALAVVDSPTSPDYSPRYVGLSALDEWMGIYELLHPPIHAHSIYKLARLTPRLIGELEDLGVSLIKDIPGSVKLNSCQTRQLEAVRSDKQTIMHENIQAFLAQLIYPTYFLDYETYGNVIPPFDGTRPYQQIPFQYSIHIIDKPGGNLQHKCFLHTESTTPVPSLLAQLQKDIGSEGSVIVWNECFEKGRNDDMGKMFPEYADYLRNINSRIVDLMIPFSKGWFVDKDFFGSASIKNVLPVLISDLSYEKLNIKEGATASRLWGEAMINGRHASSKERIIKDLLDYCSLDTLAMVQLYKFLQREVNSSV